MKILIVNAEMNEVAEITDGIRRMREALEKHGIQSKTVWLDSAEFRRCISCGKCNKQKKCIYEDEVNDIASRAQEFDGIVLFSSVYYGHVPERTKAFLERLFRSASVRFVRKAGAAFLYARSGSVKAAYEQICGYYADANLYAVLTQYYGSLQEEVSERSIQACAENMALLLKGLVYAERQGEQAEFTPEKLTEYMMGR